MMAAANTTGTTAPTAPTEVPDAVVSLQTLQSGRKVEGCENTEQLLAMHRAVTGGKPFFRFPPEPNGYLHIGHAKSMNLNFGSAKRFGGHCILRMDDTNPETENQIYIDAIVELVHWMGWEPCKVTYTSDYMHEMFNFAIQLIKQGQAYVDHSTPEMLKKQREDRTDSPWRNRTVQENLKLFEHMRQGRYDEGAATLRVKGDMQSNNPNMRDFVAYRIKYQPHPHCKDVWCIYPSYDFSHCIIDSIEHVDYSLCTLEFETRRESYFWLLQQLGLYRPHVWEFSRLNVTGSLLSKRKINALVQKGIVRGFDDARLLTLAGLRRRGYTPGCINHFCDLVGVTRAMNVIDIRILENCCREWHDEHASRVMGVVDPLRVVVTNWKGTKELTVPNHPRDEKFGSRKLTFTEVFYIDRSDFREVDDNPKYFGLAPGNRPVGLKYNGNIVCKSFDRDDSGRATTVYVEIEFDRTAKPKTNISWLSAADAEKVELRLYTPLLTDDRAAIDPEFMQYIDANSERVCHGYVEKQLVSAPAFTTVQFERFGYYTVDTDSKAGYLVMNRTLALKEDPDKKSK